MNRTNAECALILAFQEILKHGEFQRKGTTWYRYSSGITQLVHVDFGESRISVQIGAIVRRFNRATHPEISDCHIAIRLARLIPSREEWQNIRCFIDWKTASDPKIDIIVSLVQTKALSLLNKWQSVAGIQKFIESEGAEIWKNTGELKIVDDLIFKT